MEPVKVTKATKSNIARVRETSLILSQLINSGFEALGHCVSVAITVDNEDKLREINEVGKAAWEANCFTPKDLILGHFPDQSRITNTMSQLQKSYLNPISYFYNLFHFPLVSQTHAL